MLANMAGTTLDVAGVPILRAGKHGRSTAETNRGFGRLETRFEEGTDDEPTNT